MEPEKFQSTSHVGRNCYFEAVACWNWIRNFSFAANRNFQLSGLNSRFQISLNKSHSPQRFANFNAIVGDLIMNRNAIYFEVPEGWEYLFRSFACIRIAAHVPHVTQSGANFQWKANAVARLIWFVFVIVGKLKKTCLANRVITFMRNEFLLSNQPPSGVELCHSIEIV